MSAKHTPGPWRTLAKNPRKVVSAETHHTIVASCYTDASKGPGLRTKQSAGSPPREEAEANARLVAAAPELLESLEGLLLWEPRQLDEGERAAYLLAKSAIAKATGKEDA